MAGGHGGKLGVTGGSCWCDVGVVANYVDHFFPVWNGATGPNPREGGCLIRRQRRASACLHLDEGLLTVGEFSKQVRAGPYAVHVQRNLTAQNPTAAGFDLSCCTVHSRSPLGYRTRTTRHCGFCFWGKSSVNLSDETFWNTE